MRGVPGERAEGDRKPDLQPPPRGGSFCPPGARPQGPRVSRGLPLSQEMPPFGDVAQHPSSPGPFPSILTPGFLCFWAGFLGKRRPLCGTNPGPLPPPTPPKLTRPGAGRAEGLFPRLAAPRAVGRSLATVLPFWTWRAFCSWLRLDWPAALEAPGAQPGLSVPPHHHRGSQQARGGQGSRGKAGTLVRGPMSTRRAGSQAWAGKGALGQRGHRVHRARVCSGGGRGTGACLGPPPEGSASGARSWVTAL